MVISSDRPPREALQGFDGYEAFVAYVQERFELKPGELEALHDVLVKLQHVGISPLQAMEDCKTKMAGHDCLDMLRFMIYVDGLDLAQLKEVKLP